MYKIPIDEENYHINALSKNELLWGETTYKRVLTRYSKLNEFINETTKPLNLNKFGTEQLLISVTLAFCHAMKNYKQPATQEQMDKTLKIWLYAFLPYIVQNLLLCKYSHLIQFEPIAVFCHYVVNNCQKAVIDVVRSEDASEFSEFESFLFQELVNLLRAISSSIRLFFTGDDVHGISLYRGILEIFSKLMLAEKFPEEYVLFKNFNFYLQKKKQFNEPLPSEMIEYLKNEPLYAQRPENFLAYGWAKDHRGNRIMTMKQLIYTVMIGSEEKIDVLLQIASEFTHEDYVGIGYDYVSLRKEMIDYYYIILRALSCEETFFEFFPKLQKPFRHLQIQTDSVYAGKFN